jgi:hypothetical protein
MDPLTAAGLWTVTLLGVAALVRVARAPTEPFFYSEDDGRP